MSRLFGQHCSECASRGSGVFCDLSKLDLKSLDEAKTTNTYKRHQSLFYEGNQPFGIFCVASGKVKLYKSDAEGHQKIVKIAGPGDIVGYRCILSGEPYSTTAETVEDATICFIDKTTFLNILATDPKTAYNVMNGLACDLGTAQSNELSLTHKNVRERLAELFLILKEKYGHLDGKRVTLDIALSRQEIADLIGTTQESAIRMISEFKDDGLITVDKRKITLEDLGALADTANVAI